MVTGSPQTKNNIKSWKQVDLDLGRPPLNPNSQVRNWQTSQDTSPAKNVSPILSKPPAHLASPVTPNAKAKTIIDTPKTGTPDKTAPVIVTAKPSKTRLSQDVKQATTPKKRIVSDDHWKKQRTPATTASPQSAPISAQKIIPEGATHGFAKTGGSPKYNAWVRKREKSPPRLVKEEKKKESDSEEASPLDLLYWMTGKPKVPLAVRPAEYTRHVEEGPVTIQRQVQEPVMRQGSPPRSMERIRKRPILPALATAAEAKRNTLSREASPGSGTISIDELPVKPHGTRIESWLGQSTRRNSTSSSDEDYGSPSLYSDRFRLPTRKQPRGHRDAKVKPEKSRDRSRNDENHDDDYFSTPRMPRHRRYDEEESEFQSELTSPLSPNSLRRRGAKRQGKSPRKEPTPRKRETPYTEDQAREPSVSSDGDSATIYSTIENERHGPIKYLRRRAPTLVDIPPRRVSTGVPTIDTSSKKSHPAEDDPFVNKEPCVTAVQSSTTCKVTTDADLMSVLSVAQPEPGALPRARAAPRSINVKEILDDLKVDDEQYLQELKTLVDDVIPVLLSTALSKANSKDIVGVFGSTPTASATTNAIVGIGVSLERLKGCHQRMPTSSVTALLCWADNAHHVYADYLKAWRLGFQEVVINLPTASQGATTIPGVTSAGHVNTEEKTNVNVAFLLKRPLIRVKYLARSIKHLAQAESSTLASTCVTKYVELVELARRRQDEERARLEDEAATSIDPSQARYPHTLTAMTGVRIDSNRSVRARDYFTLQLHHSNGQRLDCSVEIVLRDDKDGAGNGDILICEVGPGSRWLLFPPIQLSKTSARLGVDLEELVVMIRGLMSDGTEWYELLVLRTQDEHIVRDWHRMLGSVPMPPAERRATAKAQGATNSVITLDKLSLKPTIVDSSPHSDGRTFETGEYKDESYNENGRKTARSFSGRSVIYDQPLPGPRARNGTISTVEHGNSAINNSSSPIIKRKAVPARSDISSVSSITATPVQSPETKTARPISIAPQSPTHVLSSPAQTPRRSSSPLKHEYRPDNSSATVSDFDEDYSDDDRSISSESSADDFPLSPLEHWKPSHSQVSQTVYTASVVGSLSPSDSASQAACNSSSRNAQPSDKLFASLYYWSTKGCWESIHPNDCLIIITPGLIEAFDTIPNPTNTPTKPSTRPSPIIALELTPLVPIRRGTALDISIRSPPTSTSSFQHSSNILFRSRNAQECAQLYALINQSRINNPTYIAMQNARGGGPSSNWAEYMDRRPGGGARLGGVSSWWRFGSSKKSSYRKTEHTSSLAQTDGSGGAVSSAFRRFGRKSVKSRSTDYSTSSGGAKTPPIMGGLAGMGTPTGITNKPIRLYLRESAARWRDLGSAYLTILHPADGAVISPTGHLLQMKRVLVTRKNGASVLLDVTLGETCFERVARTGIAVSVVEEVTEGACAVGDRGGVGGSKGRVFMIQMKSEAEAAYTFSLVGRLRY